MVFYAWGGAKDFGGSRDFQGEGGGGSVVANRVQRADYRKLTADELPNSSTPMADK